MNRQEKIKLLKNFQSGTLDIEEARKQMAVAKGRYTILLGKDLEDYSNRSFPESNVIYVNGTPCRLLSKQEFEAGPVEEVYV